MTKAELIEALARFPDTEEIWLTDDEEGDVPLDGVMWMDRHVVLYWDFEKCRMK